MEEINTSYDIIKYWVKNKRRATSANTWISDFITIDYSQLLALQELMKREQEENTQLRQKQDEVIKYCDEKIGNIKTSTCLSVIEMNYSLEKAKDLEKIKSMLVGDETK